MSSRINSPDTEADKRLRQILDARIPGFIMVAGAGSGKTTSLVKALAHITATRGPELRVGVRKVACITYTDVASQEIANELAHDPIVHVSTIHSFLWNVVKPFQRDIREWVKGRVQSRLQELIEEQAGFGNRVQQKKRDDVAGRIQRLTDQMPEIDTTAHFTYGTASNYGRGVLGHEDITTMVPELIVAKPLLAKLVARQFPIIFVDESQDTLPEVVACLKHVGERNPKNFCLGFFGDPMQKIYVRGVGDIILGAGWEEIKKPENFRSPQRVLDVINAIRKDGDGLHQVSGLPVDRQRAGEVTFFVLPADETRSASLQRTRIWLAQHSEIDAWVPHENRDDTKVLVIAHRMAARRLDFEQLYETFHGSRTFSDAFDEGRAWPVAPFLDALIPLVKASGGDRAQLIPLLRARSPLLRDESLSAANTRERLRLLSAGVKRLAAIVQAGGERSVEMALKEARDSQLLELDGRLAVFLAADELPNAFEDIPNDAAEAIRQFLACDVHQLKGYFEYIDRESPYSTHQGVKGTEYPYVLVVLDDEEGRHYQFSYDRLLNIKGPSQAELQRREAGEETIVERTRRLFYVCASRATQALAVTLYAKDVDTAVGALKRSGIPGAHAPVTVDDLSVLSA
jgi:DNA helicase-2/ATP-dependent DNA helicase PcrA